MKRKVLIIDASPRRGGNTDVLASALARGVEEAGGTAVRANVRDLDVHACLGCYGCQAGRGKPCVQRDGMQDVYDAWEECEAVAFCSPVYWMHFTAQLKTVLDRLFAAGALPSKPSRSGLVLVSATPADEVRSHFPMAEQYYEYVTGVLRFEDAGRVLAGGLTGKGDATGTDFERRALELGHSLASQEAEGAPARTANA